ncbi:MAG: ABC transporter substrate-binding protein [Tissierellaceae bacterium]|nr:ABC transporter substrate-binding protein [Tissierellaceae bacterium]
MMKKSIALLLVLSMFAAFLVGCTPKEEPVDTPDVVDQEPVDEEPAGPPSEPTGQFIIGNNTELSGDWIPHFQNNAAEYDIYLATGGYETVAMTPLGEYVVDETIVEKYEAVENEDGSKTYTWTIKEGLTYDDGTPITAKDYVAPVLLWSSKVVMDMGANGTAGDRFVGYEDFSTGATKEFSGVRLLGDYEFSLTIDAKHLPYYYELPLVSAGPEKLSFWTEDVDVVDDGNGAYFTENFTLEKQEKAIDTARRAIPRPSSGPYVLKSYDEASKTAVLEVNEKYAGDYNGQKPLIKTLIYKLVNEETALDELSTGGVDILLGSASGDEINAGLDLVEQGGFNYTTYPRAGYGKLVFGNDFGPTQFKEVRQAIAYLLDRNDFAKAFTGGFGSVVHGPYGEAHWFYQESKAELNEKLNPYAYSLEKAVELLEEGGWVYDENGNEYTSGIRHKKLDDGTLMPAVINWASSGNVVAELLTVKLVQNPDLAEAGIKIEETVMSFAELLNYMERNKVEDPKYGVPTYHMFNLASNFTPVYDRTHYDEYGHGYNSAYTKNDELAAIGASIALTDAEDKEGFKKKFVEYIDMWNEEVPELPLYSNIYHDFYNDKLVGFENTPFARVIDQLVYCYVTE